MVCYWYVQGNRDATGGGRGWRPLPCPKTNLCGYASLSQIRKGLWVFFCHVFTETKTFLSFLVKLKQVKNNRKQTSALIFSKKDKQMRNIKITHLPVFFIKKISK